MFFCDTLYLKQKCFFQSYLNNYDTFHFVR
jgi:hypothetical protein